MSRGVQTWAQNLPECSAEWVCAQARKLGKFKPPLFPASDTTGHDEPDVAPVVADQPASRPGGAWRAVVRDMSLGNVGGLLSSTELSQRYRALDQAQKDEYIKRGRVATQHPNQSRGSSFGLRTRDFDRLQQKRVQQAASRALVPIGPALQFRRASTGYICDDAINLFWRMLVPSHTASCCPLLVRWFVPNSNCTTSIDNSASADWSFGRPHLHFKYLTWRLSFCLG